MSLNDTFIQATKDIMKIKKNPADQDMLQVYALYKQATVGDCNTEQPAFFNIKASAKWNAWNSKKGLSSDLAKKTYIRLVNILKKSCGFDS